MNILVTTLGTTWAVVPELVGFTNPERLPLYRDHPQTAAFMRWREQYGVGPVDEIWIVTTESSKTARALEQLDAWAEALDFPRRIFRYTGVSELAGVEECRQMRDLIFRVLLHAAESANGGRVIVSLAGGRKTMSADMQDAAAVFGCRALLHVVDAGDIPEHLRRPIPETMLRPLAAEDAACLSPIVIGGVREPSPVLFVPTRIEAGAYTVRDGVPAPASTELADEIDRRLARAQDLLQNFYSEHAKLDALGNFHALHIQSPRLLNTLRTYRLGIDPAREECELAWIRSLPKSELHCHFGGIASPSEILEIARACADDLAPYRVALASWLALWQPFVEARDMRGLRNAIEAEYGAGRSFRGLRKPVGHEVPEPNAVVAFLLLFADRFDGAELLDELIYGNLRDETEFTAVGIDAYENLGDLQGSGILQSENAIRAACTVLRRQCCEHNIRLCEVRCSPLNYTRGGLDPRRVVELLLEALPDTEATVFRFLFIVSRHRRMSDIYRHLELIEELGGGCSPLAGFRERFAGVDLAGNEAVRRPTELRPAFLPLMKECRNFTIHAGEDQPADLIWEAVYHLSADRIGHGLSLHESPELRTRFMDRRIAIEMCPSSNLQIVGFRDLRIEATEGRRLYPLDEYLKYGLRVTVNTDNAGISRTNLSREYLRAARMSPGGMTPWQALQIVRNGFQAAFLPHARRRSMLLKAEQEIMSCCRAPGVPWA
ncbi:MAG: hypothetical protein GXP31_03665 [Kiritimatiellaeota bacterium]|nr:hypothetical protein [Kiritimatiellota bacterium]